LDRILHFSFPPAQTLQALAVPSVMTFSSHGPFRRAHGLPLPGLAFLRRSIYRQHRFFVAKLTWRIACSLPFNTCAPFILPDLRRYAFHNFSLPPFLLTCADDIAKAAGTLPAAGICGRGFAALCMDLL
jgi:hypothetical protein